MNFLDQAFIVALAFLLVIGLITAAFAVHAFIVASRSQREAVARIGRGECPCCGENISNVADPICPFCKNWVEGYRRSAAKSKP